MPTSLQFRTSPILRSARYVGIAFVMYLVTAIATVSAALLLLPLASTALFISLGMAFYWFALRTSGDDSRFHKAFSIRPVAREQLKPLLIATAAAVALAPCLATMNRRIFRDYSIPSDPLEELIARPWGWLSLGTLVIIVVPIVEELVDRGWLQQRLQRHWGGPAAIVVTGLFFGLTHMVVWMTPYYALIGMMLGYAVYATGSVWAGILLHMGYNASLMGLAVLVGDEQFLRWVDATGPAAVIAPFGLLVTGSLVIWLGWRYRPADADNHSTIMMPTVQVRAHVVDSGP
ncbi:MAG TPA: CPBP family intramembrane glutamic endopeptidase [Longimicrobiaceae bacterium]|nr:CPBP family intramembrane glutamic endopeptidase [Longimicrobiaceae bacterium]